MRPPVLSRRLMLEAPLRVPDGAGGYSESWSVQGQHWAEVLPRGAGREIEAGSRLQLLITVRGAAQGAAARPRAGMRFRDGTRVYEIEAVTEREPSGRWLICFASEEAGA